jgi:hypothetical protein
MQNIDLIFLFIISAFIGYYYCKIEKNTVDDNVEGFAAIDDARQAVREIYNADIDAIRNLSTVATKLQAGGLTVPGVMKTNKINLTNDKWENQHEGNGKSYVVSDDGNYKKLMLVGNNTGGDVRRVGMWDDVEISRHLQVNGNLRIQGTNFTSGDMVMNGGNNWLFHTPDNNHRTMYIAPSKAYGNEDWNWGASTEFNPDGSIIVKGNITAGGKNILGELANLQNQINTLKGESVKYNDTINITNRGTGNHEGHGRYIGFCGSGGGGCGMVNVVLSGNKAISSLKIERN